MAREPKPDFERYMITLRCEEPDRVPLGDWHVDQLPKESFMGKKMVSLQDQVDFWWTAGFDYVTFSSGILEPVRAPEGMTTRGEAVHTEYGTGFRESGLRSTKGSLRTGSRLRSMPGLLWTVSIFPNGSSWTEIFPGG